MKSIAIFFILGVVGSTAVASSFEELIRYAGGTSKKDFYLSGNSTGWWSTSCSLRMSSQGKDSFFLRLGSGDRKRWHSIKFEGKSGQKATYSTDASGARHLSVLTFDLDNRPVTKIFSLKLNEKGMLLAKLTTTSADGSRRVNECLFAHASPRVFATGSPKILCMEEYSCLDGEGQTVYPAKFGLGATKEEALQEMAKDVRAFRSFNCRRTGIVKLSEAKCSVAPPDANEQ